MARTEGHVTDFVPNPVQQGFIESQAEADLFASRVGEGKSTALAWSVFYHTKHNPGAEWALIRDTFENIQRSTMKTFFEWFPPGIYGTYHATKKEFTWAPGIAKGTVSFVGMDDPGDASKLLSWVLGGIGMDEPAPAAGSAGIAETVFDLGMQRLRQPGMKWRPMKLATNNPDEEHWSYQKFAGADKIDGFQLWQPSKPENMQNLPDGYYERMRKQLAHRPDLIRRFIDGEFGFQQEGDAVTPQFSDKLHLALGLSPVRGRDLNLLWDFGHNPTCIITQVTPMGYWNILDSFVGDGIGVEELIEYMVLPRLRDRYGKGYILRHIGDPAGNQREQTSIKRTAVKAIKKILGGTWRSGPVRWEERKNPLQAVLTRTVGGRGVVQVDRNNAKEVWHALRGGWHYHKSRSGVLSAEAVKDKHSHPGDAMSYGAAILFPVGSFMTRQTIITPQTGHYFGDGPEWRIGPATSGTLPQHGSVLKSSR